MFKVTGCRRSCARFRTSAHRPGRRRPQAWKTGSPRMALRRSLPRPGNVDPANGDRGDEWVCEAAHEDVRFRDACCAANRPADVDDTFLRRVDEIPADQSELGVTVRKNESAQSERIQHPVIGFAIHPVCHRGIGCDVGSCRAGCECDFGGSRTCSGEVKDHYEEKQTREYRHKRFLVMGRARRRGLVDRWLIVSIRPGRGLL